MNESLFPNEETKSATITSIEVDDDDPNFRVVQVAGQPPIRLPANDVGVLELGVGQVWTEELAKRVNSRLNFLFVQKKALKLLGRRAHGRAELAAKLARKCDDALAIEMALIDLADHGWLDDRAVAEQLVQEQLQKGAATHEFLMKKLRMKEIDSTLAAEVVDDFLSEVDEFQAALDLAEEELGRLTRNHSQTEPQPAVVIRRISSTLARRGFDSEMVESVIYRLKLADLPAE